MFFATYLALKQQSQTPAHQQLWARIGIDTQSSMSLVDSFSGILPSPSPTLPKKVTQRVDKMLDTIMEQAMTVFGRPTTQILGGTSAPPAAFGEEHGTGGLNGLSNLTSEDLEWIHLSMRRHA